MGSAGVERKINKEMSNLKKDLRWVFKSWVVMWQSCEPSYHPLSLLLGAYLAHFSISMRQVWSRGWVQPNGCEGNGGRTIQADLKPFPPAICHILLFQGMNAWNPELQREADLKMKGTWASKAGCRRPVCWGPWGINFCLTLTLLWVPSAEWKHGIPCSTIRI